MKEELLFRLVFISVFVLMLAISIHYRRKARQTSETIARRREGMLALMLRLIISLPLLAAILLYACNPHWMSWSASPLPGWVRWMAAGLGVACIPLTWWVFRSIGSNISETVLTKQNHKLVQEGPYRWVRHPLYGVGLLAILALSLLASNWFMALYWLLGTLVFRYAVIPLEEAQLIVAFDGEYEQYQARTGALTPRFH